MPAARSFEVLIVGGGPAGSTLARALSQPGIDVAIMDKARFPRDKVCAGWVTPAVMAELGLDLQDYARGRVLQPIHAFRTGLIGQSPVQSDFPGEPASYGIRRCEFDDSLLRRGWPELLLGQACNSIERVDSGWLINGRIQARLLVGAGGHFCPVARTLGSKPRAEQAVAAQEIEFELPAADRSSCSIDPEVPELFFTPDLKGYGWAFRKGDFLNIGLGREDKHHLASRVREFCAWLQATGRAPSHLPEKFRGHAYLLYHHARRRLYGDGYLLVGDAAGLAYPQSGEGIRPAVESALLAARVLTGCGSDYSEERLQAYARQVEARFGERIPSPGLADRLPPGLRQAAARALMRSGWFLRQVLVKRWFLHRHHPPLRTAASD